MTERIVKVSKSDCGKFMSAEFNDRGNKTLVVTTADNLPHLVELRLRSDDVLVFNDVDSWEFAYSVARVREARENSGIKLPKMQK
ncbi:MAG TPA: hypothetical protein VLE44_02610 [Candidatus Saccharimonadales bacterium]|nr:hypothetical protein [Candidatus Saccharimonadales bacterium]